MKTRKKITPSKLATRIYGKRIQFDMATDKKMSNPVPHVNKPDDLCNHDKCINPELTKLGFGQLPRHMMPQFSNIKEIKSLAHKISKKIGIPVRHQFKMIEIKNLSPTQNEISNSKTQSILDKWPKHAILKAVQKGSPIVISNTGSVIDGHHRSEALKKAVDKGYIKSSDKVRVFTIDLPAWTILSMANLFGYNKNSHSF